MKQPDFIQAIFLITTNLIKKGSKSKLVSVFALLMCSSFIVHSQAIRYSRQTLPLPIYDNMHLIPGVSGNYHLLFYKNNTAISVYSFNKELQSLGKKELPIKFRDTCDTRIIRFKNFYLLYLHKPGSTTHQLWKIDAEGQASPLTGLFQNFIEANFKKNTSTLQLINQEEELVVIAHTYYDELKVLASSVTKVDDSFNVVSLRQFSYSFDKEINQLNQVMLVGESLFMLQSTVHDGGYELQLIKADINTGKLLRKAFDSEHNFTRRATFRYTAEDQAILIYSNIGRQVFISKLDLSLNEVAPVSLLAPRLNNNVAANFFLLNGEVQQWLAMNLSNPRPSSPASNVGRANSFVDVSGILPQWVNNGFYSGGPFNNMMIDQAFAGASSLSSNLTGSYNMYDSRNSFVGDGSLPICFAVVDKDLKLLKDSVVTNKKNSSTLIGTEYASVLIGNKSHLILKQDFFRRQNGLLLLSVDSNKFSTREISVNGKFQYFLKDARTINKETLVMPYVQKNEVGLVKLSFAEAEE